MPKLKTIKKILLIGAGPTVISQTGEYDYAGWQACCALKEEGYHLVVINSNPATVMTDPPAADKIYLEPLTVESIIAIIEKERPEAMIAAFGGKKALKLVGELLKTGILKKHQVQLLGITEEVMAQAENYNHFKDSMVKINVKVPNGVTVKSVREGIENGAKMGFPLAVRALDAFEGTGVQIAYNIEELEDYLEKALATSANREALIQESLQGWKEFEFEMIRDAMDQCRVITSLENIDPVGVHTGDSILVSPAQTLTANEYQNISKLAEKVVQTIGAIGNNNLQFAQNPANGEIVLFRFNPGFTRSTALASRATGLSIPFIAAKLMVGLSLNDLMAEKLTGKNHGIMLKLPRFDFWKFPNTEPILNSVMKATGEAIAIGRDFKEALQKGLRSLEIGRYGLGMDGHGPDDADLSLQEIKEKVINPNPERIFYLRYAMKRGMALAELAQLSKIDPWFLQEIAELVGFEKKLNTYAWYNLPPEILRTAKEWGFSDHQIAFLLRTNEDEVRKSREKLGIKPNFSKVVSEGELKIVDSSFYATYASSDQEPINHQPKVVLIGSGPNRIGQSTELEYCLIHAGETLKDLGYERIIINSNPGAVSIGSSYATRVYLEPKMKEDIFNIVGREKPEGIIVQFGGQAGIDLATSLIQAGFKVLGYLPDTIQRITNRDKLKELIQKLGIPQPGSTVTFDSKTALETAAQFGYPVIAKPLVGIEQPHAEVFYQPVELAGYLERSVNISANHPVLIEKLISDAIGVEVDCIADGQKVVICGIMEQIEEAAIDPGDSACSLPPYTLGTEVLVKIEDYTVALAKELQIRGFMNVRLIVKHDQIYLQEVSPFVGRNLPFISKVTGISWVGAAVKVMFGVSLAEQGISGKPLIKHTAIKETVFSFERFPDVDTILGPEMRSTGMVIGMGQDFGMAFLKAQIAAGNNIPMRGTIFMSIRDEDRRAFNSLTKQLTNLGFKIIATTETAQAFSKNNIPCETVYQIGEGRPNILDKVKNGEIHWVISTSSPGHRGQSVEVLLRRTAIASGIPITTTVSGAQAAVAGLEEYLKGKHSIKSLQEYYQDCK